MARDRRIHLLEPGLRWPPETFVQTKLRGLSRAGFRVTVASGCVEDPEARIEGVDLVRLPPRGKGMLRRVMRVGSLRPDVVHFEWTAAALRYLPMAHVWRCPISVSCHGSEVNVSPHTTPGWRDSLRRVFDRADAVHCVADAVRREAVALGLDPAKARVIRSAVDPDAFEPVPWLPSRRELRVVCVGWLRWVKGTYYAVLALRELLDLGVPARLEVVGDEPPAHVCPPGERERIESAIADLGLEGRVSLRGRVDGDRVAANLRHADVLLHPGLSEGLPTAVLEGMSCGLPVVASDVGGMREAVRHGVDGLLVAPRDPSALASALASLWRDPARGRRMGLAGRARARSRFRLDDQVDAFAGLYADLAAAGRGASTRHGGRARRSQLGEIAAETGLRPEAPA